ncbi:MAG TPA: hypothetical protein VMX13_13695 [Sedimentisphaerales bacterium]|nr:hypothetical protein [Sedimentisphaerales bacterium]
MNVVFCDAMFDDVYIPLDSLATRLGLPKKYLKQLAEAGDIPCLDVNGRSRFNEAEVRVALSSLAQEPKHDLEGRHE